MARLIAVANPKGGSGKSTLATNVAGAFHHRGMRTLIANGDPTGFISFWYGLREPWADLPDVQVVDPSDRAALSDLRAQPYDLVVLDAPSRPLDAYAAILASVDLILIPAQPGAPDRWALQSFVDAVRDRHALTGGRPTALVALSQVNPRQSEADDPFEPLRRLGLPHLQTWMSQRVSYAKAAARGETVFEPCDLSESAREMWALGTETLEWLDQACPPARPDAS